MSKTVIEMAREAGCIGPGAGGDPNGLWEPNGHENVTELMVRFAELVRADERSSWPAEMEAMERQVNILTDALAKARNNT